MAVSEQLGKTKMLASLIREFVVYVDQECFDEKDRFQSFCDETGSLFKKYNKQLIVNHDFIQHSRRTIEQANKINKNLASFKVLGDRYKELGGASLKALAQDLLKSGNVLYITQDHDRAYDLFSLIGTSSYEIYTKYIDQQALIQGFPDLKSKLTYLGNDARDASKIEYIIFDLSSLSLSNSDWFIDDLCAQSFGKFTVVVYETELKDFMEKAKKCSQADTFYNKLSREYNAITTRSDLANRDEESTVRKLRTENHVAVLTFSADGAKKFYNLNNRDLSGHNVLPFYVEKGEVAGTYECPWKSDIVSLREKLSAELSKADEDYSKYSQSATKDAPKENDLAKDKSSNSNNQTSNLNDADLKVKFDEKLNNESKQSNSNNSSAATSKTATNTTATINNPTNNKLDQKEKEVKSSTLDSTNSKAQESKPEEHRTKGLKTSSFSIGASSIHKAKNNKPQDLANQGNQTVSIDFGEELEVTSVDIELDPNKDVINPGLANLSTEIIENSSIKDFAAESPTKILAEDSSVQDFIKEANPKANTVSDDLVKVVEPTQNVVNIVVEHKEKAQPQSQPITQKTQESTENNKNKKGLFGSIRDKMHLFGKKNAPEDNKPHEEITLTKNPQSQTKAETKQPKPQVNSEPQEEKPQNIKREPKKFSLSGKTTAGFTLSKDQQSALDAKHKAHEEAERKAKELAVQKASDIANTQVKATEDTQPKKPQELDLPISNEAHHGEEIKTTITPTLVETKPKVEEKPEAKVEPKVEPKVEVKVEPKAETKVEPKVENKVEPKVETKVEPKVETKVETKVEQKAETKIELKVETKLEPKVEAKKDGIEVVKASDDFEIKSKDNDLPNALEEAVLNKDSGTVDLVDIKEVKPVLVETKESEESKETLEPTSEEKPEEVEVKVKEPHVPRQVAFSSSSVGSGFKLSSEQIKKINQKREEEAKLKALEEERVRVQEAVKKNKHAPQNVKLSGSTSSFTLSKEDQAKYEKLHQLNSLGTQEAKRAEKQRQAEERAKLEHDVNIIKAIEEYDLQGDDGDFVFDPTKDVKLSDPTPIEDFDMTQERRELLRKYETSQRSDLEVKRDLSKANLNRTDDTSHKNITRNNVERKTSQISGFTGRSFDLLNDNREAAHVTQTNPERSKEDLQRTNAEMERRFNEHKDIKPVKAAPIQNTRVTSSTTVEVVEKSISQVVNVEDSIITKSFNYTGRPFISHGRNISFDMPEFGDSVKVDGKDFDLSTPISMNTNMAVYSYDDKNQVKIFSEDLLNSTLVEKLRAMIENPLHVENISWPSKFVLNDEDHIVGVLENKVPGITLKKALKALKEPTKDNKAKLFKLIISYLNLVKKLQSLNIFVGQCNFNSILVNNENVVLTNLEKLQVGDFEFIRGEEELDAPELKQNNHVCASLESDKFVVATVIFKLLFNFKHPYIINNDGNKDVLSFIFENNHEDTLYPLWDSLPKELKKSFTDTFVEGLKDSTKRITTHEWISLFKSALEELK